MVVEQVYSCRYADVMKGRGRNVMQKCTIDVSDNFRVFRSDFNERWNFLTDLIEYNVVELK